MARLDFTLPDFTRLAWVSDRAREVWEPRLVRLAGTWNEVEWRAVIEGVRACAVTMAGPEEYVRRAPAWAEAGLTALPVEIHGVSGQPYDATPVAPEPGQPFVFRFVVGRPEHTAEFKRAWDAADQERIGDLLGYPPCCREFFRRAWVDDAMVDTTWPMAVATAAAREIALDEDTTSIDVEGPAQANILWRWMGVRAVPHLPCRFDCPATVEFADRLVSVGRNAGFDEEMDWLLEILSWPVEWSALHGIAEVKTPVVKVSTRTDATPRRYLVRRAGDRFPEDGATGLGPPFRVPVKLRVTGTRGFRRGLDRATAPSSNGKPAWYASDNGFATVAAMDRAHRPVVAAAVASLGDRGGDVIDLGCGNGALLAKVLEAAPAVVPFGIDLDPDHVAHARELLPTAAENLVSGDLFDDWPWGARRFSLAIVMPGRLLEVDGARATALRERLRDRCDNVLVYAYGDWLAHTRGLAALTRDAGMALLDDDGAPAALATIIDASPEVI
jgi:SAM-dependent methyltransferase